MFWNKACLKPFETVHLLNENFVSNNPFPSEERGLFEPKKLDYNLPDFFNPRINLTRVNRILDPLARLENGVHLCLSGNTNRLNPNIDSFEANLTFNPIFDFEGLTQLNRDSS